MGIDAGGDHGPASPLPLVQNPKYVAILPLSPLANWLWNSARVTNARYCACAGLVAGSVPTARKRIRPTAPAGLDPHSR